MRLLAEYDVLFLLVQWVVGGAILLVGNAATDRAVQGTTSPLRRISAMALCYAGTAAIGASVTSLLQDVFGYAPFFYWSDIWAYPLSALTVAFLRATESQRRRHEVRLARSLNEQLKLADRAHQKLLHTRRRVARILHTSSREAWFRAPSPWLPPEGMSHASFSARSQVLSRSWILDAALPACPVGSSRISLCAGATARVGMSLTRCGASSSSSSLADTGAMHISIRSPGRPRGEIRHRLGMMRLQALSKEVALSEDGENVVLRVSLP